MYNDTVVSGNTIPPYNGVAASRINNYINSLYIDLIGREPTGAELAADFAILSADPRSPALKDKIISKLISSYACTRRLFELTSGYMLNGIDSFEIERNIYLVNLQMQYAEADGNTFLASIYRNELVKVRDLRDVTSLFHSGAIGIEEMMARFIYNFMYDDINMGSENFVKASFENLLYRLPTESELANGIRMVDGQPGIVFLKDGTSKAAYVDIMTSSDAFYEGRVTDAYQRFLQRKPTTLEAGEEAKALAVSKDIKALHASILKSEEYAGF
ncbi:MAG: hypothetical protein M3Q97_05810 [Bacteroidota bacterium]|nr:hypothetical protein [Bacteroidota bacterium]